jgi:LysR substrate binding domain
LAAGQRRRADRPQHPAPWTPAPAHHRPATPAATGQPRPPPPASHARRHIRADFGVTRNSAATATSVSLGERRDDVFYLPNDDLAPEWNEFVLAACRDAGFAPRHHPVTTASAAFALELVAEGSCVTLSLRSTPHPPGTVRLSLIRELHYPWTLMWRRGRDDETAIRWLRDAAEAVRVT